MVRRCAINPVPRRAINVVYVEKNTDDDEEIRHEERDGIWVEFLYAARR